MFNIREKVKKGFTSLTRGQKILIQTILNEYEDYIFLSVNEAAKILGVHKSTLVRLSKNLSYPGYSDFRSDLQKLYRQEVTPEKKLGKTLSEVQNENLLQQVVETEILYLKESLKTVSSDDILRAAELIIRARRVFIFGRGPQIPLANLLKFRLRRFHFDVHTIMEEGRAILEDLQLLGNHDVLILYSFINVLKEHLIATAIAQEVKCPVILITDNVAKEMIDKATVTLATRRGPSTIYHTNIVPLAIQSAIVLQIAKIKTPQVLKKLYNLQDLRHRFGFDTSSVNGKILK